MSVASTSLALSASAALEKLQASKLFDLYKKYHQIKSDIIINKKMLKHEEKKINKLQVQYENKNKDLRFLIRKSGTEPLLRILVEGQSVKKTNKVHSELLRNIKKIVK